eukprot:c37094_g1_i1.p1 GENE.c37094_g1_i1~~c37094_g1_i1.p1  ORF type:complete len:139 (-),score=66.42 c37094_g1_i1:230-646(-)
MNVRSQSTNPNVCVHKTQGIRVIAGEKLEIPIPVTKASLISYKIDVQQNLDIDFSIVVYSKENERIEIVAHHRCVKEEGVTDVPVEGKCILVLDNSYSWVRDKNVAYEAVVVGAKIIETAKKKKSQYHHQQQDPELIV